MPTKAYASQDVTIVIGGATITGYAEGDFLEIEYPDQGTKRVGADGEIVWSFSPDQTARATVRLLATSSSNQILDALVKASKQTKTPIPGFFVRDPSGTLIASAVNVFCASKPTVTRGREIGETEWVFELSEVTDLIGGNPAL